MVQLYAIGGIGRASLHLIINMVNDHKLTTVDDKTIATGWNTG